MTIETYDGFPDVQAPLTEKEIRDLTGCPKEQYPVRSIEFVAKPAQDFDPVNGSSTVGSGFQVGDKVVLNTELDYTTPPMRLRPGERFIVSGVLAGSKINFIRDVDIEDKPGFFPRTKRSSETVTYCLYNGYTSARDLLICSGTTFNDAALLSSCLLDGGCDLGMSAYAAAGSQSWTSSPSVKPPPCRLTKSSAVRKDHKRRTTGASPTPWRPNKPPLDNRTRRPQPAAI